MQVITVILLALVLNGCEPDRKEVSAVCSKSNKKKPFFDSFIWWNWFVKSCNDFKYSIKSDFNSSYKARWQRHICSLLPSPEPYIMFYCNKCRDALPRWITQRPIVNDEGENHLAYKSITHNAKTLGWIEKMKWTHSFSLSRSHMRVTAVE